MRLPRTVHNDSDFVIPQILPDVIKSLIQLPRLALFAGLFVSGLASAVVPSSDAGCQQAGTLTFGFLPLVSTEKLVGRFAPLVHYLSTGAGVPIRIETAADFKAFIQRTNNDHRYDLLFTAPHLFYLAHKQAGYELLASVDSPGMSAVIVAPKNSGIDNIRDLAGHKLATVGPMGLATLLVRKQLEQHGLDPDRDLTLVTTPSHNASLLLSYYGATDASSLMMPPFKVANPDVRDRMKIISVTERTPHMPVSAAPWISHECKSRLSAALLAMPSSDTGRAALFRAGFRGFTPPRPGQYDSLKWAAEQIEVE